MKPTKQDHYDRAQALMRRVIEMAHQRGIQVGIGFEFGIHPLEFASITPPNSRIPGTMLPDPTHPASIEILRNTIDDLLRAYPGLDWVWLWLHEHTMFAGKAQLGGAFKEMANRDRQFFPMRKTRKTCSPESGRWLTSAKPTAISPAVLPRCAWPSAGGAGGTQLPGTLRGLDRALPKDIVFSWLNPNQGESVQLAVLGEIAKNREMWGIPRLEGDARLWHLQPRAALSRDHVQLAARQQLKGVIAIHWRTEEIRPNFDMFARAANDPANAPTVEDFYQQDCQQQYGSGAAAKLASIMTAHRQSTPPRRNTSPTIPVGGG